jgi:hypothetical protein
MAEIKTGQAIATIIDVLDGVAIGDVPRVMACVREYLNGVDGAHEPKIGRPKGSRNRKKASTPALSDAQKQAQASLPGAE